MQIARKALSLSISTRTSLRSMAGSKDWQLGTAKIDRREALDNSDAKWVGLQALHWTDEEGNKRKWECAHRKTRNKGGVDAVAIFPVISSPGKPLSTVLVMQYRPPIDAVCVELPAGLIDDGESPEQAAVRELYEETGYKDGKVESVSNTIVADPGMTTANMALVTVRVDVKEGEKEPDLTATDPGEHIVKKMLPIKDLYSFLQTQVEKDGYTVDARLFHLAQGIEFGQNLHTGQTLKAFN